MLPRAPRPERTRPSDWHRDMLDGLRGRAGTLLAATSVVSTLTRPEFGDQDSRRALSAVAFLELLARAAPARIVPADLVAIPRHTLLRGDRAASSAEPRAHSYGVAAEPGRCDRIGSGQRLVLVGEPACVDVVSAHQLLGLPGLDLRVEEEHQDLLANEPAELLEHGVPLRAVLDERILLRKRPQVDALAEVVHVLEVLPPARVDDLEHDVPLDLARDLVAPQLLLLAVELPGLFAEVLDQRLSGDLVEFLAQLLDGHVRVGQRIESLDEPAEIPVVRVLTLGVQRHELVDQILGPA